MFQRAKPQTLSQRRNRFGFSLTELAVVLAVIGGVVGGIWAAAGDVSMSQHVANTNKQLAFIAAAIRTIYAEQGGISNGGGTAATLTASLDKLRAFPNEMHGDTAALGAGVINHEWNSQPNTTYGLGNVLATAANCTSGTGAPASATSVESCFGVVFYNLPQKACVQLLTGLITTGANLEAIIVNGTNTAFPVNIGTANSAAVCGFSPSANTVEFVYLLRDNAS